MRGEGSGVSVRLLVMDAVPDRVIVPDCVTVFVLEGEGDTVLVLEGVAESVAVGDVVGEGVGFVSSQPRSKSNRKRMRECIVRSRTTSYNWNLQGAAGRLLQARQ
jgi:hypothetical protein